MSKKQEPEAEGIGDRQPIERIELSNGTLEIYEGYPRYRHVAKQMKPLPAVAPTELPNDEA